MLEDDFEVEGHEDAGLDLVDDADEEVGAETGSTTTTTTTLAPTGRADEVVEAHEARGEGLRLGGVEAGEEHLHDGDVVGRHGFGGEVGEDGFEELEGVRFVGFGADELFEDAEDGLDLVVGGQEGGAAGDDGGEEAHEGGHVAFREPVVGE